MQCGAGTERTIDRMDTPKLTRKEKHLLAVWCGHRDYSADADRLLRDAITIHDCLKKNNDINPAMFGREYKQIVALCKKLKIVT